MIIQIFKEFFLTVFYTTAIFFGPIIFAIIANYLIVFVRKYVLKIQE